MSHSQLPSTAKPKCGFEQKRQKSIISPKLESQAVEPNFPLERFLFCGRFLSDDFFTKTASYLLNQSIFSQFLLKALKMRVNGKQIKQIKQKSNEIGEKEKKRNQRLNLFFQVSRNTCM